MGLVAMISNSTDLDIDRSPLLSHSNVYYHPQII